MGHAVCHHRVRAGAHFAFAVPPARRTPHIGASNSNRGELWQAWTTMREYRGDGHVALLTSTGLDGCEVHVLFAATGGVDPALLQDRRGWSAEEWSAAADRLAMRGFVDRSSPPTAQLRPRRCPRRPRVTSTRVRSNGTSASERVLGRISCGRLRPSYLGVNISAGREQELERDPERRGGTFREFWPRPQREER
jgi:Helix-turn-helix family